MPTFKQANGMEEFISTILKPFAFEKLEAEIYGKITAAYEAALSSNSDVQAFTVQCDLVNNTDESRRVKEVFVDLEIQHKGDDGFTPYFLKMGSSSV
jgi:hypothetical protein